MSCGTSGQIYAGHLGSIGTKKKYICKCFSYIHFLSFFGFCVLWASGGFNIGQKDGGRRTKILPGRQTHSWEFFSATFGENTFSKTHPQKTVKFWESSVNLSIFESLNMVFVLIFVWS